MTTLSALWTRLCLWNARIEDSWIGDLIGGVCLFAIGYLLLVAASVLL